MDLAPLLPAGRRSIERYGPGGFRIGGVIHKGPILLFPDLVLPWDAAAAAAITRESLDPVVAHGGVAILLLGLGRHMTAIRPALRALLRERRIAIEPMDTGAACRTYNVLLAEDREVAAALIPPV